MPTVNTTDTLLTARRRRVYSNAHAYHINSISLNSDCETYISADDLRVNLVRPPFTFRPPRSDSLLPSEPPAGAAAHHSMYNPSPSLYELSRGSGRWARSGSVGVSS
jgi:hypothetical protein